MWRGALDVTLWESKRSIGDREIVDQWWDWLVWVISVAEFGFDSSVEIFFG